ncbi:class I SAM-dependent methyltransferase [Sphingomonas sp. URHD0057]|uniref:class I SAM-dependent methyltransferase n=1 Tax=Sphingomonas sp. URHD0057 TaxID=1380389 RepID=UPI000490C2B2|nr:methyltransferase domain-containing protein [Sphingomonas sp. URHD0057]
MDFGAQLRSAIKAGRKRRAAWVRLLDTTRLFRTGEGRARLCTRLVHRQRVHQTAPDTWEERYPELFDRAAQLMPNARRILSFGCSTGEELISLRRRFGAAEIIGAEINSRSRRVAVRRLASDLQASVVKPTAVSGEFDVIFALAVLQRGPHWVDEAGVDDLSAHYPFAKFDQMVRELVGHLRAGGLLCTMHTHYLVEQSSAAPQLESLSDSPPMCGPFFGPDNRRLATQSAPSIYRKR